MITVIGMIKNSADIIECFIRGNGISVDNFVLWDNMCTDNTINILNRLIGEGYNIEILSDTEIAYVQSMKMNVLKQYVMNKYNPDIIIPLDDDEILIPYERNCSVRNVLENLKSDRLYYINWRIYVPTEYDNYDEICISKKMQYYFSQNLKSDRKIIITNDLAKNDNLLICQGNHDLLGDEIENKEVLDTICLAHFPCRSKEQIKSKALIGWTNYLAMPFKTEGNGDIWKKIYELVKNENDISIDLMWEICMLYMQPFDIEDLCIEKQKIFLPEKAFEIKYTKRNEVNSFINYIENTEILAKKYVDLLEKISTTNQ